MSSDPACLARTLRARANDVTALDVVAGFDGFIDHIIHVVDERHGLGENYDAVPSIAKMAELMAAAAGRSSLREIVVTSADAGGCSVNLADGIATLGVRLDCYATMGTPLHPAFEEFSHKCRSCTAWGSQPGMTYALEFLDGKYLLSSISQLEDFTPDLIERSLADGAFLEACRRADLIAIADWTLFPHMTDCWRVLQREIFAKLKHRPWFFIDLADPRGRSLPDIEACLAALSDYEQYGNTVFGGNLNETNAIAEILDIPTADEDPHAVADQAAELRARLRISEVSTHCVRFAAVADAEGSAWAAGPFCAKPKKSTGAGDRFNAGYCLGRALDLPAELRLTLAAATSGFFVRNARSATLEELADFCDKWATDAL